MKFINKKQFSLLELLCVIAIAAILMAMILPAFFNITKGQSVQMAAMEVGSKLKAVRTYAISQRQYVALVFITSETTMNNDRYCYKSYRPCVVNSSNVFQSWVPDEKWDILPTGVIVQDIIAETDIGYYPSGYKNGLFSGATTVDTSSNSDVAVFSSSGQTFKGISFKPTGDLSGDTKFVRVGEGTNPTSTATMKNTANYAIIKIDQYTGRISYGTQ